LKAARHEKQPVYYAEILSKPKENADMLHNRVLLVAALVLSSLVITGAQSKSPLSGFLGFSSGTINGGQGMLQMHGVCQLEFGSSARLCTSKEFWLSPNATAPATVSAWLHPIPFSSGGSDFSGGTPESCNGWRDGTSNLNGLVVNTAGKPDISRCDLQSCVACCVP
jgi:hypothetical protein